MQKMAILHWLIPENLVTRSTILKISVDPAMVISRGKREELRDKRKEMMGRVKRLKERNDKKNK